MKRIYYMLLTIGLMLTGCYGLDDENLKDLASITINTPSDVVNANVGIPLKYTDIQIISQNNLPCTIEWAYGQPNTNTSAYPIKDLLTVISDKPEIDYTFTKVGNYKLRLKVDNGESIVYKFFDLNVNSGLDEGIVVLNSNEDGQSKLAFIRTLTDEQIAAGETEFYDDIITAINPGLEVSKACDLFIADKNTQGKYPALIVSTLDEKGSIFKMDPRTFELQKILRVTDSYAGVKCKQFAGFNTSGGRYTLMNGTDGAIYRYDLLTDDIALRTDCRKLGVKKAYHAQFGATSFYHFFYNDNTIYSPSYAAVDSTWAASDLSDYQIINMVFKRSGLRELHVITRRLSDGNLVTHKMSTTFSSYMKRLDYKEAEPSAMDENAVMVTTLYSTFVYYNFNNNIYRWDYNSSLPTISTAPAITMPENEEITTLGRSHDDKYLYVCTYNATRPEKKGSLYIYDFTTQTLVKSYEGRFDRPVRVLYKYRM